MILFLFFSFWIVQKMDRNHDGVVTIDEFLDCCRCDQAITNSMLVFDSTIWRSCDDFDGNRRSITSSRLSKNTNNEQRRENSKHLDKYAVRSKSKQCDNGSSKSKQNENQCYKEIPSTNGIQQPLHHLHHQHLAVFGNKSKNNVGHKTSQTKRIQLSTAAKRCKSMNRTNAAENNNNNNSKAINLDGICEADDGAEGERENDDSDNFETRNIDIESGASNGISTHLAESPTLVKVKAWYTASSVALPSSQDVIFWYWTFILFSRFFCSCDFLDIGNLFIASCRQRQEKEAQTFLYVFFIPFRSFCSFVAHANSLTSKNKTRKMRSSLKI